MAIRSLRRHLPGRWGATPRAPLAGLRPVDVRASNLDLVLHRLAAAGIPHSVVSSAVATRTSVAVPAEHSADVAAALTRSTTPSHVRFAGPGEGRSVIDRASSRPLSSLRPRHFAQHAVVRIMSVHGSTDTSLVYGADDACDVELWAVDPERPGWRVAPRRNGFASSIEEHLLFESVVEQRHGRDVPVARGLADHVWIDDITFPVDAVYLWVDGSDPAWSERMHRHRGTTAEVRADSERFRQMEELRYSLRSLDMFAPWIRRVFIVTDDQRPSFVQPDDRLTIVDHRDIADDIGRLPTYNSDVLSSWLHRIPGLSEHFLYLNDDVFFGRAVQPSLFFTSAGQIRVFPSRTQRPLGPVLPGDDLPSAKAKNLSATIEQRFGKRPVNIVRHTPHPMTRALMAMVEETLPDQVETTRSHRFREPTDMPIEQAVHYIGQVTGAAVRSTIGYGYMNITTDRGLGEFRRLVESRDRDVFCLNDAPESNSVAPDVELVRSLLERMYPVPSRWEI